MQLIHWVIIGYGLVLVCSISFFLYMFYVVSPRVTGKRAVDFLFKVFTSEDPEDIKLRAAMCFQIADHACGYIANLGAEFKKGNTAPIVGLVTPVMDAISFRIESAMNGQEGHAMRETRKDGRASYEIIRAKLPPKVRSFADTLYVLKEFAASVGIGKNKDNPQGRGAGNTGMPPY